MGAGVPVIPTIIWGSQRIWTKGLKKDLRRKNYPVIVSFGTPMHFDRGDDVDAAEAKLRENLIAMLHEVQDRYPDSHVGQRWAPARLGGTAPAPLK
jgi:1-acyl-sn-glycerol-3-phosphate acyltransferase